MINMTRLVVIACLMISAIAHAETFTIGDIQINGLKRINRGTVLSYLPVGVKIGREINMERSADIIRALYETNFFSDITVQHRGNILVIDIVERAIIGSLKLRGNSKLPKQQLLDALKSVGIAEGQELNPAILNNMKQAIIEQYYTMGLYAAKVDIEVKQEKQNRVILAINIVEGPVSKIKSISIVGNRLFKQNALLKEFNLSKTKPWSFLTGSDKYSQEKLDADLEKLYSYYMDRGYLKFKVDSNKVSITPDKQGIYIIINVTEGPLYKFSSCTIDGELLGKQSEIMKLVTIKPGDVFSRKTIMEIRSKIGQLLGDYGYAMADIRPDYKIDDIRREVRIKFTIKPNHRIYVRKIDFTGNNRTNDEVLRREMRLQEGGLFSVSKINESTRRLANLGYIKEPEYKVAPVVEANNQVDLNYSVKEDTAISLNLQAGLSDREGFLYGVALKDQNVFGTGKSASIQFDNTKANQTYGMGYYDPYFTTDGIGLAVNGYIHKSNPNKISGELSSYRSTSYDFSTTFDFPLSDYSQIAFGTGVEHISLRQASNPNDTMKKFMGSHGTSFNQWKVFSSISYRNMDRAIFPTKGFAHSLSLDGYMPFNNNGLIYYKTNYEAKYYYPLFKGFVFRASGDVGYGDGLGNTKILPPFKNFFAGGVGTVRGFEADTIGKKEDKNKVIGANFLTVASAAIIIPNPIADILRPSIFIDVGSVHDRNFSASDLRASCGIQFEWRTPLAPLVFSFAKPIRKKSWDSASLFQFSLSAGI